MQTANKRWTMMSEYLWRRKTVTLHEFYDWFWAFSLLGIALVLETWTKEKCYTLIIFSIIFATIFPFINWPSGSRKVKSMSVYYMHEVICNTCAIYIIHKCSMWFSFDQERRSPSTVSSYMTFSDLDFFFCWLRFT